MLNNSRLVLDAKDPTFQSVKNRVYYHKIIL